MSTRGREQQAAPILDAREILVLSDARTRGSRRFADALRDIIIVEVDQPAAPKLDLPPADALRPRGVAAGIDGHVLVDQLGDGDAAPSRAGRNGTTVPESAPVVLMLVLVGAVLEITAPESPADLKTVFITDPPFLKFRLFHRRTRWCVWKNPVKTGTYG